MSMDGMLANFLTQLSRLLCTVQPMREKKQPCTETELSRFFPRDLSSSLGTVRPFCYEKMRSAWTELSPFFFLRPLLDCLRGSTPHGDHVTYCYDFSSKRLHFETILRSFWGPKRSCGPIPGSWDQSGGQGALKAKIPPFFHPLFWDLFWTSFRFRVKLCRKSIKKSRVCAQCNF